jgi:DNA-binding response OmpR family regulator
VKRKILIVDDEPINLEFFDVMLSKLGFEIEKAVDGEDALDKVSDFMPDLIILDNVMPKMSGWEVTKKLKNSEEFKDYKHIPIIMFSALDAVDNKIEGLELGVDDYITKPFVFREVLARIRAVLRHKELEGQIERREKRIEVIETLNNILLAFFNQFVKVPLKELVDEAKNTDAKNKDAVLAVCNTLKQKGQEILTHLEGLEEKIEKLQITGDNLKKGDLTPDELETQFKERFKALQKYFDEDKDSN